jgi:hypothetical protein
MALADGTPVVADAACLVLYMPASPDFGLFQQYRRDPEAGHLKDLARRED